MNGDGSRSHVRRLSLEPEPPFAFLHRLLSLPSLGDGGLRHSYGGDCHRPRTLRMMGDRGQAAGGLLPVGHVDVCLLHDTTDEVVVNEVEIPLGVQGGLPGKL